MVAVNGLRAFGAEGPTMLEYRVTKYDPACRNRHGAYARDEWTSACQIGHSFAGVVLTDAEYRRVEDSYVASAVAFMRGAGVPLLRVEGVETYEIPPPFGEGAVLELFDAEAVIRRVLRAEFWCRLEGAAGFIHLGYDYYMYVGVAQQCPAAEALAGHRGLFVEPSLSPYRERRPR